jgi:hypothetical protein
VKTLSHCLGWLASASHSGVVGEIGRARLGRHHVRVVMIKDRRRDELAMCRHAVDMTCQLAALRTLPEYV